MVLAGIPTPRRVAHRKNTRIRVLVRTNSGAKKKHTFFFATKQTNQLTNEREEKKHTHPTLNDRKKAKK